MGRVKKPRILSGLGTLWFPVNSMNESWSSKGIWMDFGVLPSDKKLVVAFWCGNRNLMSGFVNIPNTWKHQFKRIYLTKHPQIKWSMLSSSMNITEISYHGAEKTDGYSTCDHDCIPAQIRVPSTCKLQQKQSVF